ncbi:MAG: acetyltransferase [Selenomonas sp.]|jgi:peptidoglycan/LPS O-acetylase OafA/YrhL/lysophospholipase L1-like esterase|nr:acetyltransferase [Selenomonas sp.]
MSNQRISGLDALRTLAITGVTFFHMFPDTIRGGYLGVSLFFVLTGYLLAYTSETDWLAGKFGIFRYYGKRIKRIYPSLLIVLLTTIGIYDLLVPKVIAAIRPEVLSVLLGYNNWWQISQNADYFTRLTNTSPFTHLWFLGIELQYYLVWPLLFLVYTWIYRLFGKTAGIALMALTGIATAALMPMMYQPGMDVTRLYYGTDTRIYALLFGAAMGFHRAGHAYTIRLRENSSTWKYVCFYLFLVTTFCAYMLMDGQSSFTYQGGMLMMTLLFCGLIGLTASPKLNLGRYLDLPLFGWIGKRSYGIFLWQYPVIFLFNQQGWTNMTGWPLLELAAILILTVWSDALARTLTRLQLPTIGRRTAILQSLSLLIVSAFGVVLMGYGCHGIMISAEQKADDTAILQARLAANAAELESQQTAEAAPPAPAEPTEPQPVDLSGTVCIGDSVMLGSAHQLQKVLPGSWIDAEVSRYVGSGLEIAQSMNAQGKLGKLVVISLGTNGPIAGQERYEVQTRALLEYLCTDPERQIFWVNTYAPHLSWQNTNNDYINQMTAAHPNVHAVDWYGLVSQHPEWLSGDGIHPNDDGTVQYANLIHDRMVQVLSKKAK